MKYVCAFGSVCYIDDVLLKYQYEYGRCKGARIFAYLFHLIDIPYKNPNNTDTSTLLKDLHICYRNWNIFYTYIKTGHVDKQFLDIVNEVSNKFGGLPEYDAYYTKHKRNDNNNPLMPSQDTEQLFHWKIATNSAEIADLQSSRHGIGYDVSTAIQDNDRIIAYFRKKKMHPPPPPATTQ